MKKSQLRNIIRESIKQLMTEQQPVFHRWQAKHPFPNHTIPGGNWSSCVDSSTVNIWMGGSSNTAAANQAFYILAGSPQVGEFVSAHLTPPFLYQGNYSTNYCYKYLGTSPTGYTSYSNQWQWILGGCPNNVPESGSTYNGVTWPDQCYTFASHTNCLDCWWDPTPIVPVIPPTLNPGCTDPTASNYDATADGCPDPNGVVDTNDTSCCMIQPGGSTTPTNVGPPMASNDTKYATLTPNPNDPQMKRMKDLAFKGKR